MPEQAAAWQYRRLRGGDAADRRRSASVRRAGADVKLAVLGATGSVGRELVTQALAAGHEITALVRRPSSALVRQSPLVRGRFSFQPSCALVGRPSWVKSGWLPADAGCL